MVTAAELRTDFNNHVNEYGQVIRLKRYEEVLSGSGSNWDEASSIVSGASTFCKGYMQPLKADTAGNDLKYLEEGRIQTNDSKLYLAGSVNLSGGRIKFGVGSPSYVEYAFLFEGDRQHNIVGTTIYHECYMRVLNNGSFVGE